MSMKTSSILMEAKQVKNSLHICDLRTFIVELRKAIKNKRLREFNVFALTNKK